MKIKQMLSFFLIFIFGFLAPAKESVVNTILAKYANATALKIQIEKTDLKKGFGTKTNNGSLVYSKGNIFLTIGDGTKTEILYDKKKLWMIEYPDLDFDPKGKRKVTEFAGNTSVLTQQFVQIFSSPGKFFKDFKKKSEELAQGLLTAEFLPQDLNRQKQIKNFKIIFNVANKLIQEIQFTDDVQTETKIKFIKTEFLKKSPKINFTYSRKKTDEVL